MVCPLCVAVWNSNVTIQSLFCNEQCKQHNMCIFKCTHTHQCATFERLRLRPDTFFKRCQHLRNQTSIQFLEKRFSINKWVVRKRLYFNYFQINNLIKNKNNKFRDNLYVHFIFFVEKTKFLLQTFQSQVQNLCSFCHLLDLAEKLMV